jgi:hypothetical protein
MTCATWQNDLRLPKMVCAAGKNGLRACPKWFAPHFDNIGRHWENGLRVDLRLVCALISAIGAGVPVAQRKPFPFVVVAAGCVCVRAQCNAKLSSPKARSACRRRPPLPCGGAGDRTRAGLVSAMAVMAVVSLVSNVSGSHPSPGNGARGQGPRPDSCQRWQ